MYIFSIFGPSLAAILLDDTAEEVKLSPHYLILKSAVALTTFCLNIYNCSLSLSEVYHIIFCASMTTHLKFETIHLTNS